MKKLGKRLAVLLVNHPKVLKLALAGIMLAVAATIGVNDRPIDDEDDLVW